ncbi:MAG: hypothetical protein WC256_04675 [Desulfurivibrionaceae bacterium]|jgi:Ca2+-binding RTX toxin-like protein
MAITNEELIVKLYNGLLLRNPTGNEASFWLGQLNLGLVTPVGIISTGVTSQEFAGTSYAIASMYQAAFGRYGSKDELMAWRQVYDTGLSLADMGRRFILSTEFSRANPGLSQTADYVRAMATTGLGRSASQAELDVIVPLIENGTYNYGHLLWYFSLINGRGAQVALAMLSAGLNGLAPSDADITALGSDIPVAINTLLSTTSSTEGLFFAEMTGNLVLSGTVTGDLVLDLTPANLRLTVDGVSHQLNSGNLANVISVRADGLSGGPVLFTGSSRAETYTASGQGDTVRGADGNDFLSAGTGVDTFIFEATDANGMDTITNYLWGTDGDLLDFSRFLNQTATNAITVTDANSTGAQAWSSGEVLAVEGSGLTSTATIAGLFGANRPLAAPTTRGKAVVITADIVGDASAWYIVNNTDITSITANEVTLVAQLIGVNNLGQGTLPGDGLSFAETEGTLSLSGTMSGDLTLDLGNLTLTIAGVPRGLQSGSLANTVSVNAAGLSGGSVIFAGDSSAETYIASGQGDTIRGAGGNDILSGGAGADTFTFEETTTQNGVDLITGYQKGSAGDVLDFSAYLNLTNSANVATIAAGSAGASVWSNGDVLVVKGYGLTSAAAVAGLFGAGLPLAAPTAESKAVVITADIVGDASVWYILNQTDTANITANEITLVAELVGVNNLGLVGFDSTNFA